MNQLILVFNRNYMRNIKIALANSEESIEKSKKIRENQCKNAKKTKLKT